MNAATCPVTRTDTESARNVERQLATVTSLLVRDDEVFVTVAVGLAVARALERRGMAKPVESPDDEGKPWPLTVTLRDGRCALVVVEVSSMEPNLDWPVNVREVDLQSSGASLVIACYSPKRPALEAYGSAVPPEATIVGWMTADEVRSQPATPMQPHEGHPFACAYHTFRVDEFHPFD